MQSFSRPISSACCERIFSYLEKMDDSDKRNMKKETLRRLLFLRGNWRVLHQIVEEDHATRVSAGIKERKRRARDRAIVSQALFDAQHAAAGAGEAREKRGGGAAEAAAEEDEFWEKYEAERWNL